METARNAIIEAARQAISYHRFSTGKQAEGDSDDRYAEMLSEILRKKGLYSTVTGNFRGFGIRRPIEGVAKARRLPPCHPESIRLTSRKASFVPKIFPNL